MKNRSDLELDLTKMACPRPVVETRRALQNLGDNPQAVLKLLVDNPAAAANVTRFAESQGFRVEKKEQENGTFLLRLDRGRPATDNEREEAGKATADQAGNNPATTSPARTGLVYLNSDEMGRGEGKLGRLLIKAFLQTLPELENPPAAIILVNRGVFLATRKAAEHTSLRALAETGCEILVCGTCLDFYNLQDELAVGRVSNMFEIASRLAGPGPVIRP